MAKKNKPPKKQKKDSILKSTPASKPEKKLSKPTKKNPQDSNIKGSQSKTIRKVTAELVEDSEIPKIIEPLEGIEVPDLVPEADIPVNTQLPAIHSGELTTRDPLLIYLNEIRKYPVLSREDELKISREYFDTKDPELAQKLVKSNLRFVVKIAAEYSRFGSKMIDLIQEGNVGLMHAVKDFNPYKGVRLITYAVWWIRGYIQEYLMRQYSLVRIGTTQNQRKLFYQLQKQKQELDKLTKVENAAELSEKLGIPVEEISEMAKRLSGKDLSLDRPVGEPGGESFSEMQRDTNDESSLDEKLAHQEQLEILRSKLKEIRPTLTPRELIILDERILNDEPLTLQEIGDKYGITREAVRQMEARVMKKIKEIMPKNF